MIERISLGRKLIVLLGLPLFGLLVMVSLAMSDRYQAYTQMQEVAANTRPAFAVSALARDLFKERVLTYMALSDATNPRWAGDLESQRPATDKTVEAFDALLDADNGYSDEVREHLNAGDSALDKLTTLRSSVSNHTITADDALAQYSGIAQELMDIVGLAADRCEDVTLKQQLTSVFLLQHVIFYADLERGYVQHALTMGAVDADTLSRIIRADQARLAYGEAIIDIGTADDQQRFRDASVGRPDLDRLVNALEHSTLGAPLTVDGSRWWGESLADIDRVREMQEVTNEDAAKGAEARLEDLWRELLIYAAAGAGLTFVVVGVGWGLSRAISASLVVTGERSAQVGQTIVAAVQQLSAATNETATMVAQTSTTVDEIRKTSEAAAQRAQEVADSAGRSRLASNDTRDAVRRGGVAMQNIRQEVEGIAQTIVELSSRTIQISEIVQSVGAIAEQSNLLAVNASIEAAKAGEYGRGFSVVASEVKALAQQSKEATDRIRQILAEIQKSSNAAVMITEQGVKRVEEGSELITEMGRGVEELANVIAHSADAASQILLTAREQVVGVEEIAQAMQSIEQATKENAAGAHQLESAATTVKAVAVQLGDIVHGRAA